MLRVLLPLLSAVPLAPALSAAPQVAPGHRLYGPHGTTQTYLVDVNGTIVHTWESGGLPGNGLYLEEDGVLLRSLRVNGGPSIGGVGGGAQRIAFNGTVLWDFTYADSNHWAHHDVELLPNGNVLFIAWDLLTTADAVAAGRDPALLSGTEWYPDSIVEVQQTGPTTGTVVWEWHMMDHVVQDFDSGLPNFGVVADHPELLDINYPPTVVGNGDWNHANSIDYDPVNDLILLNCPFQDEFYLIDHSTTTAEAAGHTGGNFGKGGDILYRWGNPAAYDAGTVADQQLFNPHGTSFIPEGLPGAGNLIGFNNQAGTPFGMDFSAVYELDIPSDFSLAPGAAFGPTGFFWEYTAPNPTDLYSSGLSSAERLPNGNTLVVSGRQDGWMFELTEAKQTVWEYFNQLPNPSALVFQVSYYERTLWASTETLALAAGATVDFALVAGTPHAGDLYLVLGSLSGTDPGVAAGLHTLPLNVDAYFLITLTQPNTVIAGSLGTLDGLGRATAGITLPAGSPPALAGLTAHHAFVTLDPGTGEVTHASNAVPLELNP